MRYRVDFLRHGLDDWLTFDTRRDADMFVEWGQEQGSAFIDAVITEEGVRDE